MEPENHISQRLCLTRRIKRRRHDQIGYKMWLRHFETLNLFSGVERFGLSSRSAVNRQTRFLLSGTHTHVFLKHIVHLRGKKY